MGQIESTEMLVVEVRTEGDEKTFLFQGEPVLVLSKATVAAKTDNVITIIMRWVPVVFDIFGIVSAAAGLVPSPQTPKRSSTMLDFIGKHWPKLKKILTTFGNIVKKVTEVGKALKRAQIVQIFNAITGVFKKLGNIVWGFVKLFFMGIPWWQWLLNAASLAATIALLCLSAASRR